jgi:hypothetical protein
VVIKLLLNHNHYRLKRGWHKDVINPNLEDQNYLSVLCDTKKVEDEKHFLLNCSVYTHTHIRSHFQNIDHTTNLPSLLTQQKYGDLGKLLLMLLEHRNIFLKNNK